MNCPFDLLRVVSETTIRRVEYRDSLASTNDFALQQLQSAETEVPLLVLAGNQTRGRGRGRRTWWSGEGALTFSVALALPADDWPRPRRPLLGLAAGLAVCGAIGEIEPAAAVGLKWPNDVYLDGRKLSGILVESPARPPGTVVVGIGVNANNSLVTAPLELRQRATSLCDAGCGPIELTTLLVAILRGLDEQLRMLVAAPGGLAARWRDRCLLTGRQVTLDSGLQQFSGRCTGIDDDGQLVLETASGTRRFASGSVQHVV